MLLFLFFYHLIVKILSQFIYLELKFSAIIFEDFSFVIRHLNKIPKWYIGFYERKKKDLWLLEIVIFIILFLPYIEVNFRIVDLY